MGKAQGAANAFLFCSLRQGEGEEIGRFLLKYIRFHLFFWKRGNNTTATPTTLVSAADPRSSYPPRFPARHFPRSEQSYLSLPSTFVDLFKGEATCSERCQFGCVFSELQFIVPCMLSCRCLQQSGHKQQVSSTSTRGHPPRDKFKMGFSSPSNAADSRHCIPWATGSWEEEVVQPNRRARPHTTLIKHGRESATRWATRGPQPRDSPGNKALLQFGEITLGSPAREPGLGSPALCSPQPQLFPALPTGLHTLTGTTWRAALTQHPPPSPSARRGTRC